MSLQALFNEQALQELPKVWAAFCEAESGFDRGQIESIALRELSNCTPCLDDMSQEQKNDLDSEIMSMIEYRKAQYRKVE